jgi:DNA-binding transcriptional LysR family regulator
MTGQAAGLLRINAPVALGQFRINATVPRFLAASPAYLARRGVPAVPDDLSTHDVVRFAWTPGNTIELFRGDEQARLQTASRFRVNNALAIREALVMGSGIGMCPDWLVRDLLDRGELVRVLEGWTARAQDLYLLYPSRQFQPLRTKLFIDFAVGHLRDEAGGSARCAVGGSASGFSHRTS